ncbi:MAG: hypothetical protein RIQ81_89 [Pseudomonadota bacterium]
MRSLPVSVWWFFPLLICAAFAGPSSVMAAEPGKKAKSTRNSIEVEYDKPVKKEDSSSDEFDKARAFSVEALLKNSVLASGLASGTDALNHSLESLMHTIFYGLMDNEFRFPTGKYSWIGLDLTRDLYSTRQGPFVVVDKIAAGPRYARELYKVQRIPVVASADTGLDALDIYLRTDAARIAEKDELPFWRVAVNNWFGLVPLLAMVLPPSFDPNELYDPLRRLEAPFRIPTSSESFYKMPVNSIRSYGLSGGVGVSIDFEGLKDQSIRKALERMKDLKFNLPIGIFVRGEYRINVLRKSEHIAWIGVVNLSRKGANVRAFAGNTVYLLSNVIPFYRGIPGVFAPVDLRGELAWTDRTDRVYEFDLRTGPGREAYEAAVLGDFTLADQHSRPASGKSRKHVPGPHSSGVSFHFRRNIQQQGESFLNNRNLVAMRDVWNQERNQSEVAISESGDTYHLLEARHDSVDQHWDMLVGSEDSSVRFDAKIKVRKLEDQPGKPGTGYRFEFVDSPAPLRVTALMDLEDRYTTVVDLRTYIQKLGRFTGLEFEGLPDLPVRDPREVSDRFRTAYFQQLNEGPLHPNARTVHVGRFSAAAAMVFDSATMDYICARPDDEKWRAFATAFGLPESTWATPTRRKDIWWDLDWAAAALAFPLRILHFKSPAADAIAQADRGIKAMKLYSTGRTPMEKRQALYQLFDSDYAPILARALMNLAIKERVPRRVKLFAEARGEASEEIKRSFDTYDGRVFTAGPKFPVEERFSKVERELEDFQPQSMRPNLSKSSIRGIRLLNRMEEEGQKGLQVVVRSDELTGVRSARLYVKFAQAGKLQLTNLSLVERVVTLKASKGTVVLQLTGADSPFAGPVYDRLVSYGGPLSLTIALAPAGAAWTERQTLKFNYENGALRPFE